MPKLSKRLASLVTKVEERAYEPLEAIQLVKDNANAKFDETMEAHVRLGIDPKYTDQQLRTTVALPHGTGQTVRIAVVTSGEKVAAAKAAGAAQKSAFGSRETSRPLGRSQSEGPVSRLPSARSGTAFDQLNKTTIATANASATTIASAASVDS